MEDNSAEATSQLEAAELPTDQVGHSGLPFNGDICGSTPFFHLLTWGTLPLWQASIHP
jgi:hypothetical protein